MTPAARSTGVGRSDNEPRTEAGRALLAELERGAPTTGRTAILAIEREAANPPSPAAGGLREDVMDGHGAALRAFAEHARREAARRTARSTVPEPPAYYDATEASAYEAGYRAALASGASSSSQGAATTGLDVERLARAIQSVDAIDDGYSETQRASLIAAAYRLTPVAGSASEA